MASLRYRDFCVIGYPDSLPDDWMNILVNSHVPILISPLHDKDINSDGSPKKPHYHILMKFEGKKSTDQIKEMFCAPLHAPEPEIVHHFTGYARYLIHMDNPEKHQYNKQDIVSLGGLDIDDELKPSNSKIDFELANITKFIQNNKIKNYATLLCAIRDNDDLYSKWWSIAIHNTICIKTFITSYRKSLKDIDDSEN